MKKKWIILIGGALLFYFFYKKKNAKANKAKVDNVVNNVVDDNEDEIELPELTEPPKKDGFIDLGEPVMNPNVGLSNSLVPYSKPWWIMIFKSYPGIAEANPEQQELLAEEHFARLEKYSPEKIYK